MLALIKRRPDVPDNLVNKFFKSNKTLFPEEATAYFSKLIDKNLQSTGDRYYEAITDAIRQMMKSDLTKANEYLNHIRTHYKRRTSLMSMLYYFVITGWILNCNFTGALTQEQKRI